MPATIYNLVGALHTATLEYGLNGQLNVKLQKFPDETRKAHTKRLGEFTRALSLVDGVEPSDIKVSGQQAVIFNPGKNIRAIVERFSSMQDASFFLDKIKGVGDEKVFGRAPEGVEGYAAAAIVRAYEKESGVDNPNIPGKFTRKIIDERIDAMFNPDPRAKTLSRS